MVICVIMPNHSRLETLSLIPAQNPNHKYTNEKLNKFLFYDYFCTHTLTVSDYDCLKRDQSHTKESQTGQFFNFSSLCLTYPFELCQFLFLHYLSSICYSIIWCLLVSCYVKIDGQVHSYLPRQDTLYVMYAVAWQSASVTGCSVSNEFRKVSQVVYQ